ncbi:hypothetical protein HMPREF1415_00713 [Helicobacter pylori GAM254Ai]|nr:hypothetical protein HMPREF1415_00713 [Helicobacter pylori GAM254Ai]
MPHATNHKSTTATEKNKMRHCEKPFKHQMLECIVFFYLSRGVS